MNVADQPLIYLGGDSQGGTYVLGIAVEKPVTMPFGQFRGGKKVAVPAGSQTYVGSALAEQGATCLARRIVRHATRTGRKTPHAIREQMLDEFPKVGLGAGDLRPKNGKHLRWNVDHLLDKPFVHLVAVWLIRNPLRLEREVAELIQADPNAVIYEPGLGANDLPGCTNLLLINGGDAWFGDLAQRLWPLIPT